MRVQRPEPDLQAVLGLYDRGLYVQALRLGTRELALEDWTGTEARIVAGRLASNLGAERRSCAWHSRSWRADPAHPSAILFHAYGIWRRLGPLAAWDFLEEHAGAATWSGDAQAELLALRAHLLATFRDFERAEQELAKAEHLQPGDAWLGVMRSSVLELADEYEAALAAADRVLQAQPCFRPAVQQRGELLQLLDRSDQAIEYLSEACLHLESYSVEAQLATLLRDRERWSEAEQALIRCQQHALLAEPELVRWITAMRSNLAGLSGDDARSLELAQLVETTFHKRVERFVARPPSAARKLLPVVFVRQHHMTCGPATLTALSRWFGREADHLEIAERTCYGGTNAYSERSWAEERGYLVREFTLTARSAVALVDRGFPFGVETRETTTGHLQAVIGYDDRREVLLVRDPYQPLVGEWPIAEFFERYRATGPRAFLLVPRERAAEVEDIVLDDEALHDGLYRVEAALRRHDHAAAAAEVRALGERAPDHLVALGARRALCAYEQDSLGQLTVLARLCDLHPACDRYLIEKLGLLRELGRKQERLDLLHERVREPRCDPALLLEFAQELGSDARTQPEAARQLRRALRRALSPHALWLRSSLQWESGQRERATESARFAACLEVTNEGLASNYFSCCLALGRTQEALGFLRTRQQRFAKVSSLPAQGLCQALERLARAQEGLQVLEAALLARPDDAGLALFCAGAYARCGRIEDARARLEQAAPRASRRSCLEIEAGIELRVGNLGRALQCWLDVLAEDPLDVRAQSTRLRLVRSTAGPDQQYSELRELAGQYPFHPALQRLCIQLLGREHASEAVELLVALLARHPDDAWAQRELALRLVDQQRLEEALRAADEGLAIEPSSPASHGVRGIVLAASGLAQPSVQSLRKAVELDVDYEEGLQQYVAVSSGLGQGVTALEAARAEFARQATNGRGIEAWANAARGRLAPERILQELRELAALHPGVWLAQLTLIQELIVQSQAREALPVAEAATARFPLQSRLWCALAAVHAQLHDPSAAHCAAQQAALVEPNSVEALHLLADRHVQEGQRGSARELLERAASGSPLEGSCHEKLVRALIDWGESSAAIERADICVRLFPREERAWRLHASAARAAGQPELSLERLRALAAERPKDSQPWLLMAQLLDPHEQAAERRSALRRAVELDPRHFEAVDLLAQQLVWDGRAEEARTLLDGFRPTREQQPWIAGRRAWVLGESGSRAEAAERLEELVRADPQYRWARVHLTRYYRELEDKARYHESAAHLVELDPRDASALEELGYAALLLERKDEAERHFRTALEVDPRRGYAAEQLIELLLGAGRHAEVRETLERVRTVLAPDDRASMEMRLLCAEGNFAAALEHLRELSVSSEISGDGLIKASIPLDSAGRSAEVLREFQHLIQEDGASAPLGAAWMERVVRPGNWTEAVTRLLELRPELEATGSAARELLARAYEADAHHVVLELMRKREELLRRVPSCWGHVAAHLSAMGRHREVIRWCKDWRRDDARPWMLYNLATSFWRQGQLDSSEEVMLRALSIPPDGIVPQHELLMACTALVRWEFAKARLHVTRAVALRNDFERSVHELVMIALEMQDNPDRAAGFLEARRRLEGSRPPLRFIWSNSVHTRVYRACLWSVARRRGGFWAHLWALLHYR